MKRVSRTLLLVGGILGCVATVGFAIAAIIFFIFASPAMTEMLTQMYEDGVLTTTIEATEMNYALQFKLSDNCPLYFANKMTI